MQWEISLGNKYKLRRENVILEEINLPQDQKWLLDQEQKQHEIDFYGFDVAAQGRLASRSKNKKWTTFRWKFTQMFWK